MIGLIISLFMILLAAEGFTNGVESFGKKHKLSQAVAGSILAAVGTALPETILPLVAILFNPVGGAGKEIGVGAILGAPFMLATVALMVVFAAFFISYLKKDRPFEVTIEAGTARRDLSFFIVMYSSAVFIPMVFSNVSKPALAVFLILGYFYYVYRTVQGESLDIEHDEGLHIYNICKKCRLVSGLEPSNRFIVLQILVTLVIMVSGAHIFVKSIEVICVKFGMSPLLFALIVAPIATELPEKFNSFTWVMKGKDTLAFGNLSGAMVFQSTFPVSVGLLMTEWHVAGLGLLSAVLAIFSAVVMLAQVTVTKKISPYSLLLGGILYLVYFAAIIISYRGA